MSWETSELGKIADGQKRRPLRKRAPFLMAGRIKDREDREVYSASWIGGGERSNADRLIRNADFLWTSPFGA